MNFAEIPESILAECFYFLDIKTRIRIEGVHSNWERAATNTFAWSGTRELIFGEMIADTSELKALVHMPLYEILKRAGINLKAIRINDFEIVLQDPSGSLAPSSRLVEICPNLESVILCYSHKDKFDSIVELCDDIGRLFSNLGLKEFVASFDCDMPCIDLTHTMVALLPTFTRLKQLYLGDFIVISLPLILCIHALPNLEVLGLRFYFSEDWPDADQEDWMGSMPQFLALKELSLFSSPDEISGDEFSEGAANFVATFVGHCPLLECLAIESDYLVSLN